MNFIANESEQKLRGGYYTPQKLADFICSWVITDKTSKILEPSCGDGVFINSVARNKYKENVDFLGIEINPEEAIKSKKVLSISQINGQVLNTDFLQWYLDNSNTQNFDAVIGNPPFIRYQYMPSDMQFLAQEIFKKSSLKFSKHTNAWISFIIASIELLSPGGRFGMIIPSEIFNVIYAQELRTYLGRYCSELTIIDPEDLWFEDLLQGVIILFAEKKVISNEITKGLGIIRTNGLEFCEKDPKELISEVNRINGKTIKGKWTLALLTQEERSIIDRVEKSSRVKRFREIASVDVGIVTGANSFFLVNEETVRKNNLEEFAHPMFGRSNQCPGVIFSKKVHDLNVQNQLPSYFIWINTDYANLNNKQREYIKYGEKLDLEKRYKCRIRKPWYTVPSVYSTKIGMLKRSNDLPRLILNEIGAYTTDTAYRVQYNSSNSDEFVFSFVNSLTALSAELEGRSYGGGVLELVPSEIENLLIPITDLCEFDIAKLDSYIQSKNIEKYIEEQDRIVLSNIGISEEEQLVLRNAWIKLKNRRQRKTID